MYERGIPLLGFVHRIWKGHTIARIHTRLDNSSPPTKKKHPKKKKLIIKEGIHLASPQIGMSSWRSNGGSKKWRWRSPSTIESLLKELRCKLLGLLIWGHIYLDMLWIIHRNKCIFNINLHRAGPISVRGCGWYLLPQRRKKKTINKLV